MKKLLLLIIVIALGWYFIAGKSDKTVDPVMEDGTAMEENKEGYTTMMEGAEKLMLDAEASTLTYFAEKIVGNSHTGTVDISTGEIYYKDDAYVGGSFVMDMTTITESKNNEMFIGHVKSDDFFGVEMYPESKFVIKTLTENEEGTYDVVGDLTIRDKTNEISFPAMLVYGEGTLTVTAEFQIDRTQWGVVFDSGSVFTTLGDKAIKDEIDYSLSLAFADTRAEEGAEAMMEDSEKTSE